MPSQALLLSPEVPFPTIGGGALRTASLFEFLARHFTLDVITFRQPHDPDPRELFPLHRIRALDTIDLPFHSKSAPSRVIRNLKRAALNRPPLLDRFSGFDPQVANIIAGKSYDLGVIEHFWCAPYQQQLRQVCRHLVLDLHNVESDWHSTAAKAASGPARILHRRFANAYEALERDLLPKFDTVLTTSETDRARAKSLAPNTSFIVFPNAIPFVPLPSKSEQDEIIFTGNLEYEPNISAIRWFANEIWPTVRSAFPNLTWVIAGKNAASIRTLVSHHPGIHLCQSLPNAIEQISRAKLAVVPLLAGSGTRIKILEAWAAGTAVVSTSLGAQGLLATSGRELLLADSASDFSGSVINLLRNPAERIRIAQAGRQAYEMSYTWQHAWKQLTFLIGV